MYDPYGAFKVSFINEKMIWKRQEDGMDVKLTLARINKMPMAPADKVIGLWALTGVKKGNNDITSTFDPSEKQFIFIRPDKRYRLRKSDESIDQGFWHMDAHKPEFTLINYDRTIENKVFVVSFENNQLQLKPKNDSSMLFIYKRINKFPK